MEQALALFGALLLLWGNFDYARDTFRGVSQPNRVSFVIWGAAPMIGAIAALTEGVTWAAVPMLGAGIGPFMTVAASFFNKKAYWKLGPFDWICGVLSVMALVGWMITRDGKVAIFFAILSDLISCLPTLKKSWTHPHSETWTLYAASIGSSVISLVVAKSWDFAEVAFPIYLILICALLWALVFFGQRRTVQQAA